VPDSAARARYALLSWPVEVAKTLEWYVYALRDPRPGNGVFDVGKGQGGRLFAHVKAVLSGGQAPDADDALTARRAKAAAIRGVHAVEHLVLRDGLSEQDA
jgi:hypothetical protein